MIHLTKGPPLTACFQKRSNCRALFTEAESAPPPPTPPPRHLLHSNHLNMNRDDRRLNVVDGFKVGLFSWRCFCSFSHSVLTSGRVQWFRRAPPPSREGREGSASAEDVGMLDKCLQHRYFCCSRIPKEEKLHTHVGITLNPWTVTMLWPLRAPAKVIKAGGVPRAFAQMPEKPF